MSRNISKEPEKDDEKDLEKDDELEYIETRPRVYCAEVCISQATLIVFRCPGARGSRWMQGVSIGR